MFDFAAFTDFTRHEIVVNGDAYLKIREFAIAHEIGPVVVHGSAGEDDLPDIFMAPRDVVRFRLRQDQLTPAPTPIAA